MRLGLASQSSTEPVYPRPLPLTAYPLPLTATPTPHQVKVVLAAAMWGQPHIVILDEPTNYLDRDSLAALAMVPDLDPRVRVRGGVCPNHSH